MKTKIIFYVLFAVLIFIVGCKKDKDDNIPDDDKNESGILNVKQRTWNTFSQKKSTVNNSKSTYSWDLIDVRAFKYELKFTTDEIQEGMSDSDINWVTVYTSNDMKLDSERDFQFELPAGNYKGFALLQGNDFFWVLSDGNNTIEIPASNGGESGDKIYNVFGTEGLYIRDSIGLLQKVPNDEKIGTSFTILPETEHSLTIRMNFDKIVWNDNDDNGDWSDGDTYEMPTLPDGIETMVDFIFE